MSNPENLIRSAVFNSAQIEQTSRALDMEGLKNIITETT